MKCPFCQEPDSRVLDSRTSDDGTVIRRRRECPACRRRFTTYERMEERPLMVVKKDGSRESFNRDKLMKGILKAVEKRPVGTELVEKMVNEIERELRDEFEREATSESIGEKIMSRLKTVDQVAYIRFASVYRQFTDVEGFVRTVEQLKSQDSGEEEN